MSRPRLLDLFCGAGGCSVGYARAGFDVVGVDIAEHPDYPYPMLVRDAMDVLTNTRYLATFDVVHASPPCPRFSTATRDRGRHPDHLTPTLTALRAWGGPWVVENVPGAAFVMRDAVLVCGKAMGLPEIRRHRLFASNLPLMSPGCECDAIPPWGVYGDHGETLVHPRPGVGTSRGRKARDIAHAQELLGIDWMTSWDDLTDAIPPLYTEYLGDQLIDHLALTP